MDYLLHHSRRISDMDMGDSGKGGWGMSRGVYEAIKNTTMGPDFDGLIRDFEAAVARERERKAGMSKFKVGDKVRRVKHTTGLFPKCPIGFETVVSGKYSPEADGFWYEDNRGCIARTGAPDDWELIEPAHQGPVRTVTTTRKEIDSGTFGNVKVKSLKGVSDKRVGIALGGDAYIAMTASSLRAAAETFTQLADALESGE